MLQPADYERHVRLRFGIAITGSLSCNQIMTANSKLRGILSLSSASMALLQSVVSAKGDPSDKSLEQTDNVSNGPGVSQVDKLILSPVHHEELVRLYAGHRSHASHSSHSSHVSGDSGTHASHYSGTVPVAPAPASPATPQPPPAQPKPQPRPVVPVPKTNAVTQTQSPADSTNSLHATNELAGKALKTNDSDIVVFLKKRSAEGSADAQFALADYYLHGRNGVKQDVETAKLLLEMSASQGNEFAKQRLEELQEGTKAPEESSKQD